MALQRFSNITESGKLRQGLSHIRDLKHEQVGHLLGDGTIRGHVTEKSDGMAFEVGHDESGFYSRTSHSEKMRNKGDYHAAAHKKFGSSMNPQISGWHDDIHHSLHQNQALQKHLAAGHKSIRGEIYDRAQGTHADKHHVRFVGTAYDTRKMGKHGSFIVHTRLPENAALKHTDVHKLGDHNFKFDHDHVDHPLNIPAHDLKERHASLNSEVLHSRKKADSEAKETERGKFDAIKTEIHRRVANHTGHLTPKWGPETEGHVIHPHDKNLLAPRVKVVDGNFMARKNAGTKFVKEELLLMGGNIHMGDQKTVPIKIEDRDVKAKHVDEFMHSVNKHSGGKIFGGNGHALKTGTAYSGSSRHMMNKDLKSSDLGKYKKTFGDVDVMVPHHAEPHVLAALQPGQKHGHFTVQGVRKVGTDHTAIVKHTDGSHHQIDFEYKDHDKHHEPTKFAQWSQNSHIKDLSAGIKGVVHKHLINAVTMANSKPGIVETKMKTKTKHEETDVRDHTFSPQYGMRAKHVPAKDEAGNHIHHAGKPVYHEVQTKDAVYDRDLHSIHHKMFGHKGNSADIEDLHSFHGTTQLMRKHLNHEQVHKTIKSFVGKLYGKEGRPHESDEMKDGGIAALKDHFPKHFDSHMEKHIADQKKVFSAKHRINESEGGKKDLHVAMAAGRFTGPTSEHQKLIDNVLKQKTDHHYVFVMGPSDHSKTTEKDPLTIHQKISHLKKLYPEHKHVFVPGIGHAKNPAGALSFIHFRHKDHAENMHLHVLAGEGDEGVEKNAGGSIDSYKTLYHRLNHSTFPVRTDEHGKQVGGDKRMEYKSATFHPQARGTVSGSKVRKFAREHDHNDDTHVHEFKKLLHTGTTHEHAREIMSDIKGKSINEARVVGYEERRKRAQNMRMHEPLMKARRAQAATHMAGEKTLQRHSRHTARDMLRDRVAGLHGKKYHDLTTSEKMRVDKMIEGKDGAVTRIATRLLPKERQKERDRLHDRQRRSLNEIALEAVEELLSNQ